MGRKGNRRASIALLREAFPALGGPQQSTVPEEILRAYYPLDYADTILAAAKANGLPPYLVAGIIRQESAFDPRATSPVGARGLMQLMPADGAATWLRQLDTRLPGRRPLRPRGQHRAGLGLLRAAPRGFDGNVELALAGYNGGPNRIRRLWDEAGPTPELDDFVENLASRVPRLRQAHPGAGRQLPPALSGLRIATSTLDSRNSTFLEQPQSAN